jgi:CRP-like cAMP-binding protein
MNVTYDSSIPAIEKSWKWGNLEGLSANRRALDLWEQLRAFKMPRKYCAGDLAFEYGQPASGIYLVESGQLRLSMPRQSGRDRIFEVVGPGCVLGLSEALSGEPHKLTAQAVVECNLSFVDREKFMQVLRNQPELCMHIVRQLSEDLHGLYYRYRTTPDRLGKPRKKSLPPHVN